MCTQHVNRGDHSAQIKTTPSHKRYARPRQWPTGAPAPTEMAETLANSVVCPRRRANAHQGLKPCSFSLRAEARTWLDGCCAHIAYAAAAPRFTSLPHHDLRRACTSVLNVPGKRRWPEALFVRAGKPIRMAFPIKNGRRPAPTPKIGHAFCPIGRLPRRGHARAGPAPPEIKKRGPPSPAGPSGIRGGA